MANKHFRRLFLELTDLNADWNASITAASLSSGLMSYPLSSDSSLAGGGNIRTIRVEVKLDGTNWVIAQGIKMNDVSVAESSLTDISNAYSSATPAYSVFGSKIYILPAPILDVASGMNIFEVKRSKELTGTGNIFADALAAGDYQFPKEGMEILEEFITADIYERIGKIQEAVATRTNGERRLHVLKGQLSDRAPETSFSMQSNAVTDYGE